jgi:arylsulfatase
LISVDTQRADRLGFLGYPGAHTPHLDQLAADGVSLEQAITPMPRTTPGLASLLTGLWPKHHGSREVGDAMTAGSTLAELLGAAGYGTLGVSTNASAGPKQNLDRGFDRFVTYEQLLESYGDRLYYDTSSNPASGPGWGETTTDEALRLAAELDTGRPLFLWVFYFDPHFLYRPPSPWQNDIEAEACWRLYEWGLANLERGGEVYSDVGGISSAALEDCSKLYDAEIAYTDAQIGRLIEGLRQLDRFDDALVIFTADHGENLGEEGLFFEHGDNVHDAAIRVPLLFRHPALPRGAVDGEASSLVDVVPTVLSLLDLESSGLELSLDGEDLSARLRAAGAKRPPRPRRITFAESANALWNHATEQVITGRPPGSVCIHDRRYTLCRAGHEPPGRFRLYDHLEDPRLQIDVAGQLPDEVARLAAEFDNWEPESARHLTARLGRYKLVRSPRLEGGYRSRLVDLEADPSERLDHSQQQPRLAAALGAALDAWMADIPAPETRQLDPELDQTLRTMGYLP